MERKIEVARMIREQREGKGITLAQLAEKSGVSLSHIARIEKGERFPSASVLRRLAKPLHLSEGQLLAAAGYLTNPLGAFTTGDLRPRNLREVLAERGDLRVTRLALGLPVGAGEIDQPAEPLVVPAGSRAWLGDALAKQVERSTSAVNRGAVRGSHDPGHLTLVAGRRQDFIAGYRLDGWGWLWRIGGFWPNPDVALPVAVKAMEHIYTHPPLPVRPGGVRYLWHAIVTSKP